MPAIAESVSLLASAIQSFLPQFDRPILLCKKAATSAKDVLDIEKQGLDKPHCQFLEWLAIEFARSPAQGCYRSTEKDLTTPRRKLTTAAGLFVQDL